MTNSKNNPHSSLFRSMIGAFVLLIVVLVAVGCGSQPTQISTLPENTPLPTHTPLRPSPSSTPIPTPTSTPTLQLIDNGLVYLVVGLSSEDTLPIHQEPTSSAGITGEIPATGKSIRTTGIEIIEEATTWLQIEYQGVAGWVDLAYLARQQGDLPEELVALAQSVTAALKSADYSRLEEFIHPELCLRFSPYPYLQSSDLSFCPGQLTDLPGSSTIYTWGLFDGSGDPIELTFDNYHQRFVYDQDFFQPDVVGLNQEVSAGNAINNIPEIYPDGMIVEYHFPGFDPQYAGMDWRSIRMVFIQENEIWYLVALVHGEWTI